jgi:hypothetical protein
MRKRKGKEDAALAELLAEVAELDADVAELEALVAEVLALEAAVSACVTKVDIKAASLSASAIASPGPPGPR